MNITSYTADFQVEHSFFGKARPGSFEPVANLCHSAAKDHNCPEAEEVKLLEIVHAAIGKFFKQYPKTRARIVVIRLFVGSSLKSLKFYAEGYFAPEYASWRPTRPTGDILKAETDLYKQEYRQYLKDQEVKIQEYLEKHGFHDEKDHSKVWVHFMGKSVVKEMWEIPQMEQELHEIAPDHRLITSKVYDEQK